MPTYLSPGVYVEEVPAATRPISGVGTAIAAFVGFAEQGPINEPTLVTNWTQYTSAFGDITEGFAMAKAVYGYFNNGGGRAYIVRLPYGGSDGTSAPMTQLTTKGDSAVPAFNVTAINASTTDLTVQVAPASGDGATPDTFDVTVLQGGQPVETYPGVSTAKGRNNVLTQINQRSKLVRLEALDAPADAVSAGLADATLTLASPKNLPAAQLNPAIVIGDVAQRSGFGSLEMFEEITMVLAPDVVTAQVAGLIDFDGVKAIQTAMISHCELMGNRMAILDTPAGLNAQQASDWRVNQAGFDSKFAVAYWPWLQIFDPSVGHNVSFPPSGYMAGIWSRNDDTRGVFKAPANEVVQGAVGLDYNVTRGEMDMLNPQGVNSIKAFPGRGIRVWGGRTLSSDAEWRYINVRRYFNYLEESILQGTQWCVFEPNDERLWGRIRRTVQAFLVNEWRSGALFGATPKDAFFVKCDGENNTAESIDAGMVVCEIGVAPVKPAEFVIFKLAQFSGGTSVSE
jgi:phage tail sheath protein FI